MSTQDSDATMAVYLDLENIVIGAREAEFPALDIRKVIERLLPEPRLMLRIGPLLFI